MPGSGLAAPLSSYMTVSLHAMELTVASARWDDGPAIFSDAVGLAGQIKLVTVNIDEAPGQNWLRQSNPRVRMMKLDPMTDPVFVSSAVARSCAAY
jgi:hypothetical protein